MASETQADGTENGGFTGSIGAYYYVQPGAKEQQSVQRGELAVAAANNNSSTATTAAAAHLGPGKNSTASYVKKSISLTLLMEPGL